jgi:hypothetical protein
VTLTSVLVATLLSAGEEPAIPLRPAPWCLAVVAMVILWLCTEMVRLRDRIARTAS